jgi:glycosyltransferase involved in cell wall biosynthesis
MVGARGGWRNRHPSEIAIDVVVPVLNEARVLARSIRALHVFLTAHVPHRWRIVIAENGSTDNTEAVGQQLCRELERVHLIALTKSGRGGALRAAWSASQADVVSYTDVDLSTELSGLVRLFEKLIDEGYDLAVGSRRVPGSNVTRSLRRRVLSNGYNRLLGVALDVSFTDAQAGFKALTREVVCKVLPLVQDQSWFFDTELLVLAERLGYRIADVPVRWIEDDDSRVKVMQTALDDLRGVARLRAYLRSESFDRTDPTARKEPDGERALR